MAKKKITRPPQYVSKEERAKKKPKKPMSKQLKYGLIIGACVLVVAIVLFAILYDDGSLPVKDGVPQVGAENWIVANTGSTSSPKYYHIGAVDAIEGYALNAESELGTSADNTFLDFEATDPEAKVSRYYVSGMNGKPDESAENANASYQAILGASIDTGEVQQATFAGRESYYFLTQTKPEEERPDASEGGYDISSQQQLVCYMPAVRDLTILVVLTVDLQEGQEPLPEADLLAAMETIAGGITFDVE